MSEAAPPEIDELARARAEARREQEWSRADELRGQIEAAGWKVVDDGLRYRLSPARPPDVVEEARVRYGASASVPSRLDDPPTGAASVVMRASDWPEDVRRAVDSVRRWAPDDTSVVVVADAPGPDATAAIEALETSGGVEIVWTSAELGQAGALNSGLRRAGGGVVIVLDPSVELVGDAITPLVRALDDPAVAVAGGFGVASGDLRHFEAAPAGDVDAIEGYALAFRRDDYRERGPLDERFRFYRNLDLWWSLVLRDEGEDRPARRAVAVDLPLVRHEHRGWTKLPEAERERLSRRNFYRIIDRFGARRDLLREPAAPKRRG